MYNLYIYNYFKPSVIKEGIIIGLPGVLRHPMAHRTFFVQMNKWVN